MDHIGLLLQHSQFAYAIPVVIVLIFAILVFVCGFKQAEQPPFAQLSDVDRKLAKKRGKVREKKTANGHVNSEKTSPIKKTLTTKAETLKKINIGSDDVDKLKENKQYDNKKEKEQSSTKAIDKKNNKVEQVKNKKNLKNMYQEKPTDFDDGNWEQAYSRKDKKNKKNKKKEEETFLKKNKKTLNKIDLNEVTQKEQEKPEIKDKIVKETENKELKEKEKKEIILTPISNEKTDTKEAPKEEQNKEKFDKVEKEEKKPDKPKKNKKYGNTSSTLKDNELITEEQKTQQKTANVENVVTNMEESKEKIAVPNELGDVWTETKPQKKNKKKTRRDN